MDSDYWLHFHGGEGVYYFWSTCFGNDIFKLSFRLVFPLSNISVGKKRTWLITPQEKIFIFFPLGTGPSSAALGKIRLFTAQIYWKVGILTFPSCLPFLFFWNLMGRKLMRFCGSYLKNLEKTWLNPAFSMLQTWFFSSFNSTGLFKKCVSEEVESYAGYCMSI